MERRLKPARTLAMGLLGGALLVTSPWVGWWTAPTMAALVCGFLLMERQVNKARRPEWWMAAGWLIAQTVLAMGVVLTGGARSAATAWLAIACVTLPITFNRRGVYAGLVVSVVLLAAATIGADPGDVKDQPQLFIFPLALIGAIVTLTLPLRSAEIAQRAEAVIDQLTGLLNRKALKQRVDELERQSRLTGQPIGLIVCDIDHFKAVNDTHGHATGDAVLTDLAYRIRKALRAYDLAYRLGGEEFVVLVPGADLARTETLAEHLRAAVEAEWVAEIPVTMSFGVAASGREGLAFESLFAEADEALYRAKASGRNRVCTSQSSAFAALGGEMERARA